MIHAHTLCAQAQLQWTWTDDFFLPSPYKSDFMSASVHRWTGAVRSAAFWFHAVIDKCSSGCCLQ